MASEPPEKRAKTDEANLLGPPYRWLLPDCRCFYSENLYVKRIGDLAIDRYFKLDDINTNATNFWRENHDVNLPEAATDDIKSQIYEVVRKESKRRLELSAVYRHNATMCKRKYVDAKKMKFPELYPAQGMPVPNASPAQIADNPPDVAPGLPAAEVFTSEFLKAWSAMQKGVPSEEAGLRHVHLECFEIPVFTAAFATKLKEEILHFKGLQDDDGNAIPHQFPNNMNRSGCILNEIGLGPLVDRLIQLYIGPLCKAVYPRLLSEGFDAHHSFVVAYRPDTDNSLGVHDDNSEVTVNIALSTLGKDYEGASLAMYKHAREKHPQEKPGQQYLWKVPAGTMLFHPGEMLHEVLPITKGFRLSVIMWLRSNNYRKKHGCPLCGSTEKLMYENNADNKELRRLPSIGLTPDFASCSQQAERWQKRD